MRLTYGYKPPRSSFYPPTPGCWYVLPDLPNGLYPYLAQAPVYDQESESAHTALEQLRHDTEIKFRRNLYRGDLVQLIGHFTDLCGKA